MENSLQDKATSRIRMDEEDMPPEIRKDMQYIERTKIGFCCKVCRTHIELTTGYTISKTNLALHCQGKYHNLKVGAFKEPSKPTPENTCKGLLLYQDDDIIQYTDLKVDEIIEQNELYIKWQMDSWFCRLCKVNVPFSAEKKCRNNLAFHLDSRSHQSRYKQELPRDSRKPPVSLIPVCTVLKTDLSRVQIQSLLKKQLKASFITNLNERYFSVKENLCFCDLCKVPVGYSKKGLQLEKHCKSNSHIWNLHTMAHKFLTSLNVDERISALNGNQENLFENELQDFVSELKDGFPCVAPSLKFICLKENTFLCLLCNVSVKKSQEGGHLKKHLESKNHKKNCYKLLQDQNKESESSLKVFSQRNQNDDKGPNLENTSIANRQEPPQPTKSKRNRKKKSRIEKQLMLQPDQVPVPEDTSGPISILKDTTATTTKVTLDNEYLENCITNDIEVNLNEKYFKFKENLLHCEACNVRFDCSVTTSTLQEHCQSVTHNMRLSKIAISFVTKAYKKPLKVSGSVKMMFTEVLHEMCVTFPSIKSTHHLEYIVQRKRNCVCILCNTEIEMLSEGVGLVKHFFSDAHKENDYKLFCKSTQSYEKCPSDANFKDLPFTSNLLPNQSSKKCVFDNDDNGNWRRNQASLEFTGEDSDQAEVPDCWEDFVPTDSKGKDVLHEHSIAMSDMKNSNDQVYTFGEESDLHFKTTMFSKSYQGQDSKQRLPTVKTDNSSLSENMLVSSSKRTGAMTTNYEIVTFGVEGSRDIDKNALDLIASSEESTPPSSVFQQDKNQKLEEITPSIQHRQSFLNENLFSSCSSCDRMISNYLACTFTDSNIVNGKYQDFKKELPPVNCKKSVHNGNLPVNSNSFVESKTPKSEAFKLKIEVSNQIETVTDISIESAPFNENFSTENNTFGKIWSPSQQQIQACPLAHTCLKINSTENFSSYEFGVESKAHSNKSNSVLNTGFTNETNSLESDLDGSKHLQHSNKEAILKRLLRKSVGTNLNAQYFCIEGEQMFCQVCQEIIAFCEEDPMSNASLNRHCNSKRHNTVLETVVENFVSNCSDIYQKSGYEEDWEKFKLVLAELQQTYPFNKFHYLLKYLWYKNDTMFCLLCQQQISYNNYGKFIVGHFFKKLHRDESKELVVEHLSMKKNSSQRSIMESNLKHLLKTIPLQSQYFCIKDDNVFCKVCLKEIECDKLVNPLDIHSKSTEHNNILEEISTDFKTYNVDKFQLSLTEENSDKLNIVLCELKEHSPFYKFQYCLNYIGFINDSFICNLCDKKLPFTEDGCHVTGHLHGRLHRDNCLQLVHKYHCIEKTNLQEEQTISSKNSLQKKEENYIENNSSVDWNPPIHSIGEASSKTNDPHVEDMLKNLLKSTPVTSTHSQYFCVKGNNFFCQVCSEVIQFTRNISSLDIHCKSLKHNSILEQVATHFVSVYGDNFPMSQTTEDCDRFKLAFDQVQNNHPYSLFKYCLTYLTFNSHFVFCVLCDKTLPSENPVKSITRHLRKCKTHRNKSLELVLKHVLETKNRSQEETCVLSNNFQTEGGNSVASSGQVQRIDAKENLDAFYTNSSDLEAMLKPVLKTNSVTLLHSQYFCVKDNNFFCQVCSEEIKCKKQVTLLLTHCASSKHNTILENIALDFVSCGEKFQQFQSEESCDKFKQVICELQEQYPFANCKYFLTYIAFDLNSFFCVLCDRKLPYARNGKLLVNHILNNKTHKSRSLELALKHKNQVYPNGNLAVSSEYYLKMENDTEHFDCSTKNSDEKESLYASNAVTSDLEPIENLYTEDIKNCTGIKQSTSKGCILNIEDKASLDIFLTDNLQAKLKRLLKTNKVTAMHSQYFCIKETNFFCYACSEEIEFTDDGTSLSIHCTSLEHNQVLENIALNYAATHLEKFQTFHNQENCDKFEQVIHQLQEKYPCRLFNYCLNYITFDSTGFVCVLCDKSLTYTEDGGCVSGHLNCKQHKAKTLELVLKPGSEEKTRSTEENTKKQASVQQRKVEIGTEVKASANTCFSVAVAKEKEIANGSKEKPDEMVLKSVLMTSAVTSIHSQYFCVKNDNFFCQVCLEEIKLTKQVTPFENHCKSYKHNQILESIASNFVSTGGDDYQTFQSKENLLGFKKILCDLQDQHPFSEFKHFLKYIRFNADSFICILCGCMIPNDKDPSAIVTHLSGKRHRNNLLKLVTEPVSMTDFCLSLPKVIKDSEAMLESETAEVGTNLKILQNQNLLERALSKNQNQSEVLPSIEETTKGFQESKNDNGFFNAPDIIQFEVFNHSNAGTCKNEEFCLSESTCDQFRNQQESTRISVDSNCSETKCNNSKPKVPNIEAIREEAQTKSNQSDPNIFSAMQRNPIEFSVRSELNSNLVNVASNDVSLETVNIAHGIFEAREGIFICTICKHSLQPISPEHSANAIIQTHITSQEHKENQNFYSIIKNTPLHHLIRSKISMIVHDNKQFMGERGQFLYCNICHLDFANLNNDLFSHLNFALHFESFNHKSFAANLLDMPEYTMRPETRPSQSKPLGNQQHRVSGDLPIYVPSAACTNVQELTEDQGNSAVERCLEDTKNQDETSICPECKESFEIYNNDLEFSLQVHVQKHKSLTEVNTLADNEKLLENLGTQKIFIAIDGTEFSCRLCNCKVSSSTDKESALEALQQHIQEMYHQDQYDLYLEETSSSLYSEKRLDKALDLKKEALKDLLGQVNNEVVNTNQQFIEVKGNLVVCTLCSISLTISPHPPVNASNLEEHFKGLGHTKHINRSGKPCSSAEPVAMKTSELQEECLRSVLEWDGNGVIKENQEFIEVRTNQLICTLCSIPMPLSLDPKCNAKSLQSHFSDFNHNKRFCSYSQICRSIESAKKICDPEKERLKTWLGARSRVLNKNIQYIEIMGSTVFCIVCKMSMSLPKDPKSNVRHLTAHFETLYHTNCLKRFTKQSSSVNPNTDKPLRCLIGQVNSTVMKENEQFIEVRGSQFFCTLCSIKMSVSPSSIINSSSLEMHFKGNHHTGNRKNKII